MSLKNSLAGFFQRGGASIISAGAISRVASLFVALFVAKILTIEEYGFIGYLLMIIAPLVPVAGGALDFGFLRYGSFLSSDRLSSLLSSTLRVAFVLSLCLCFSCILLFSFYGREGESYWVVALLVFMLLIVENFLRFVDATLRIRKKNSEAAKLVIIRSLLLFLLCIALVPNFGLVGYSISLLSAPLIVCIYYGKEVFTALYYRQNGNTLQRRLISYSAFVGLGALVSQGQMQLAGILYAFLDGSLAGIAKFKLASLIPFSLLFLPNLYFKSEFVHLVQNRQINDKLWSYLKGYFLLICGSYIMIGCLMYFLGEFLFSLLFGEKYDGVSELVNILMLGILGAFILRQPFGNLLAAAGYSLINLKVSVLGTIASIPVMVWLIHSYGVTGAAWSFVVLTWLSGVLSIFSYLSLKGKKAL